jgi:PAS domain S-box-containing protein
VSEIFRIGSASPPRSGSETLPRMCQVEAPGHFAEIFDQLGDGFFSLDADWRFTYLNPAARNALLVDDEVLGRAIWDVYPEALETIFETEFRRAMSTASTTEFEAFYPANLIWLRINAFPIDTGLAVCFADVTQARKARQKLIDLNRQLRERDRAYGQAKVFAQTIAHDLLQPLSAIVGFSEALSASAVNELGPDSARYLRNIQWAARHMTDVSKAILLLCGIGRAEMEWSRVDVGELATECIDVLRAAQPNRPVRCSVASGLWVRGDPGLIRVALQNLLSNAYKFSRTEGDAHIEVGAERSCDGQVVHFVRDNGIGFDACEAESIFQPFRRLHDDSFEGDGIGLATVKSIVERHGGRIWAVSQPRKGATFYFTLPTNPD